MNPNSCYSPTKPVRTGTFYIGVAPDNLDKENTYTYLNTAQRQAREWTEETGIKFFVYEEVSIFKPIS